MIVMIPLIQLLLFGYAINTNVRNLPVAVVNQSHSEQGRILVADVAATQVVKIETAYATPQLADAIIQGKVRAVLIMPADNASFE